MSLPCSYCFLLNRKGQGLITNDLLEGSMLGVWRWDAAALPQPTSNPAHTGLPERHVLVRG